ncbi:MAG: EAL domain-containing protein [Butyrivibrio sp.]|nr:EAL domain-containing protein [Butyrivibrio sp.]
MSTICVIIRPGSLRIIGRNLRILAALAVAYNILDIATSFLINLRSSHYYVLCYVLLFMYFSVLFIFPFQATHYFFEICGEEFHLPFTVIPVFFMHLLLFMEDDRLGSFFILQRNPFAYYSGTATNLIYVYYAFYVVLVAFCAFRHSRYLGATRQRILLTTLLLVIVACIYRVIVPGRAITGLMMGMIVCAVIIVFYFVDVTRDPLTRLNNRSGFLRVCDELVHKQETVGYRMTKLQIYDLQGINERLGMEIGDELLIRTSQVLKHSVIGAEKPSICARIGGDTFGIFTPEELPSTSFLSMSLKEFIGDDRVPADYVVSFYAGVYHVDDENYDDIDGMLERADFALRKVLGNFYRNVAYYEGAIRVEDERRKAVEQRVRGALQRGEFRTYLQPVHDSRTRALVSAEALIRWIDSSGHTVSPSEFVPILENNGFIRELDMYMLENVCRMQRTWIDEGLTVVPISVNVSRVDLRFNDAVDDIINTVDRYHLDHRLIKIELTESAFVDDNNLITRSLTRLHNDGFPVMMDDFGSGYSNLNMFKDMPIDIVKIDMAFLKGIEDSKNGTIVVESVVNMAKRLGMQTVVEGVETQMQYDFIRSLGCEMIQGYYFSRPIPSEDFQNYSEQAEDVAETSLKEEMSGAMAIEKFV